MIDCRIVALLALPAIALQSLAATAVTPPVGFLRKTIDAGSTPVAASMLTGEILTSRVDDNAGELVVFADLLVDVGALLATGQPCFLEVLSGPLEGERIDLNWAATQARADNAAVLDFTAPHNTKHQLAAGALAGSTCAIRTHLTLEGLQQLFSPGLAGGKTAGTSDRVYLFDAGVWKLHYLSGDNITWLQSGDTTTDQRVRIIPPGTGVLVQSHEPQTFVQTGAVRTNAFRMNLVAGFQVFAPPYPVDLCPIDLGAFEQQSTPAGERWFGSTEETTADQIHIFEGHSLVQFWLQSDGSTWLRCDDAPTDQAGNKVLSADSVALIKRANPDPAHVVLPPFSL